jgi:hypothetical protein
VPIDYRYHIGSFVAIFVALLLGILIGIGLAPSEAEFKDQVAELKQEYRETRDAKAAQLALLQQQNEQYDMLTRETVAAVVTNRLANERIAIVLDHDFGRSPLPANLRAVLKQAGATVTSTTTFTRDFITLPQSVKQDVSRRLNLYPPPGVHFRTLIAQAIARDLARGRPELILDLHASQLLVSAADSDYSLRPDAVLIVGGSGSANDASAERIDLPLIQDLAAAGLRVVGAEPSDAAISVIPTYKASGIPTIDHADTPAGRLAVVLALAGANGHYGTKDTADSFLPPITASAAQ